MKKPSRLILSALTVAALAATLPACAPLVVGGAAVTALSAVDRRASGAQVDDGVIEFKGAARLRDAMGDRSNVSITSFNRQVLLTGEVPDAATKETAGAIARKTIEEVVGSGHRASVVNELTVMPASSLTQRSNDLFITAKVKAALVDTRELTATAFKVVTERGSVFLMGRVTQREAALATQVVRNVSGVNRVVRVLEEISEDELRRLTLLPPGEKPGAKPAPVTGN